MIAVRPLFAFALPLVLVVGCSGSGADSSSIGKAAIDGNTGGGNNVGSLITSIESDKLKSGTCPYSPAPAILGHAICVCNDFALAGPLVTRATLGGSASVGVNKVFSAATDTHIAGALVAQGGVNVAGTLAVRDELSSHGDVSGAGTLDVGRDLSSGGDVGFAGDLEVGGALRVAGALTTTGATSAARAPYQPVAEPCGCDGSQFFDVAARVTAARALNDNAKLGLEAGVLSADPRPVTLTTGNYYFTEIVTAGARKIRVEGAVAIHVEGDVASAGDDTFDLAPGATLDLFVKGNVQSAGDSRPGAEASFRLYVAGDQVVHAGAQKFHAMLYAPRARVAFAGDTVVYGAVFAKEIAYAGSLTVDYRAAALPPAAACTPDPTDVAPPK